MHFGKQNSQTRSGRPVIKWTLIFLGILHQLQYSSALLYIVRQNCNRGTVFTPAPSTTSNICLQCVCVMANISYCKPLIVQLSTVCSAALVVPAVVVATAAPTTARPATTVAPVITIPTIPTVATAVPTTSVGINPRASTPAASAMMVPNNAPAVMIGGTGASPVVMMMMTGGGTAGMQMTTGGAATMAPAPAPAAG